MGMIVHARVYLQDKYKQSERQMKMNMDICEAIRTRAILRFTYKGLPRIVMPHAHGISERGNEVLRGVQIGGESESGKMFFGKLWTVAEMNELEETGEKFSDPGPGYNPDDKGMREVHCHL